MNKRDVGCPKCGATMATVDWDALRTRLDQQGAPPAIMAMLSLPAVMISRVLSEVLGSVGVCCPACTTLNRG